MAFTLVKVTHRFLNPDNSPASGVVIFRLSARITNSGVTYAEQVPVHATLTATGDLSQTLPANNDPTTTPKNSSYLVTFLLNGYSGDEVNVVVPYTAKTHAINLGTLLPAQEGA